MVFFIVINYFTRIIAKKFGLKCFKRTKFGIILAIFRIKSEVKLNERLDNCALIRILLISWKIVKIRYFRYISINKIVFPTFFFTIEFYKRILIIFLKIIFHIYFLLNFIIAFSLFPTNLFFSLKAFFHQFAIIYLFILWIQFLITLISFLKFYQIYFNKIL